MCSRCKTAVDIHQQIAKQINRDYWEERLTWEERRTVMHRRSCEMLTAIQRFRAKWINKMSDNFCTKF